MTLRLALADAFAKAREAAEAVADGDDGGSANLDCCFLESQRLRRTTVEKAAAKAGVTVSRLDNSWWHGWFVHGVQRGQGAQRTRMAEAARSALAAAGYSASVYY